MLKFRRKSLYLALVAAVCSVGIANTASALEANDLSSVGIANTVSVLAANAGMRTKISTETIIGTASGVTKLSLPGSRFAGA